MEMHGCLDALEWEDGVSAEEEVTLLLREDIEAALPHCNYNRSGQTQLIDEL